MNMGGKLEWLVTIGILSSMWRVTLASYVPVYGASSLILYNGQSDSSFIDVILFPLPRLNLSKSIQYRIVSFTRKRGCAAISQHACFRSTVTDMYNRFPDVTSITESEYEYFISELNFDAIDGKIITGAA